MPLFEDVNYLAVVVATVVSFIFGSIYYMVLAKPWAASIGKTPEQIKEEGGMSATLMIITAIAQLVMAFILAAFIRLVTDDAAIADGLVVAFFIWLGFIVTTMIVNHGFQGAKSTLTVIDSVHWLGVLLLQGLVLGWMGGS